MQKVASTYYCIITDKSKVVQYRKGRRKRTEFVFKVGDIVLEVTEKYKYLGVMFSEKGDFNLNATNLAKAEVE